MFETCCLVFCFVCGDCGAARVVHHVWQRPVRCQLMMPACSASCVIWRGGAPCSSCPFHGVQPSKFVHQRHVQCLSAGFKKTFVSAQDSGLTLLKFFLDCSVRLGGLDLSVVVLRGAVKNCVAVFPHVPRRGMHFVDECHCPA